MEFEWYVVAQYWEVFAGGLLFTLQYTGIAIVTSVLFGTLVAGLIVLDIKGVKHILNAYVVFFRETPLLVQIYFIYYALPVWGLVISAPVAGVVAITLNEGAFIAEIVRGGVQGIHRGQFDAAKSLALSRIQSLRLVIMPQALRNVFPSLIGQASIVLKDTSLLSVLAVEELTSAAGYVNSQVINPLTSFVTAAVLYVAVFWLFNLLGSLLERRLREGGQRSWT